MTRIVDWFRLQFNRRWSVVHIPRNSTTLYIMSWHWTEQTARVEQRRLELKGMTGFGVMRTWHVYERNRRR